MTARAELRRVTAAKQTAEEAIAAAGAVLEAVAARLAELDEQETAAALGEIDAADLEAERAAALERRAAAEEQARRARSVLAGIGGRVEAAVADVAREDAVSLAATLEAEVVERRRAEKGLAGALAAAEKYGTQLAARRARIDELRAELARLGETAGDPLLLPDEVDERWTLPAGWANPDGRLRLQLEPESAALVVISSGPRTPVADAQEAAEGRAVAQEAADRKLVNQAGDELARMGAMALLGHVPARLMPAVEARAAEIRARVRQQQEADEQAAEAGGFAALAELAAAEVGPVDDELATTGALSEVES